MDLSNLKPADRIIEIVHPATEENLGVRVTVMSITDERMAKIKRRFQDERLRLEQRNKTFKAEEVENNLYELTAAAITSWEWYGPDVNFKGEKPNFDKYKAMQIFKELPWFHKQIQEAIGAEEDFFQS